MSRGRSNRERPTWSDRAAAQFDATEMAALLFAIVEINAWNRLAITARVPVGDYQPDAA